MQKNNLKENFPNETNFSKFVQNIFKTIMYNQKFIS